MMMCNKQVITYMEGATELLSVWDWRVAGGSFWFLIIQFWFYLIILIILENIKYVKAISNFSIKKTLVQPKPYVKQDPDVNDEV